MPNSLDKTMRLKFFILTLALCLFAWCAPAQKVKDFANRATLQSNDLFSVSINAGAGTRHVSFGQMSAQLSTNSVQYSTNAAHSYGLVWKNTNQPISELRVAERMPLPHRMWGTWNDYGADGNGLMLTNVSETNIILQALWMKTNGMWDAGWRTIIIEEGWNAGLNADGTFIITNRFPNGMKFVADYLHDLGFVPGIYTSVAADGPAYTCMGFAGTCYTNFYTHMRQFAEWDMELVFMDNCAGYSAWTQAPAGVPVASGDEVDLYRERLRMVNDAVEKANFKRGPCLVVVPPQKWTGSTNVLGSLQADQQASWLANVAYIGPTNGWDFFVNDAGAIARYMLTNAPYVERLTGRAHFSYGYIMPGNLFQKEHRLAVAWDCVLPATMSFQSSGERQLYWTDTTTYAPSTWMHYTDDPYNAATNLVAFAIHQDPAVIPGHVVYSNNSAYVVVRHLGSDFSGTNAVLLVNYGGSAATFQLQHKWLGVRDSRALTYQNVFFGTNVGVAVTSNLSITLPANDSMFLLGYPATESTLREWAYEGTFYADDIGGTGASDITPVAYGPSPWYSRDGVAMSAANQIFYFFGPIPHWATNVQFSCEVTTAGSGTVAWTNHPGYEIYDTTTRTVHDTSNDAYLTNGIVLCTSGNLTTYTTGFPVVSDGKPRVFSVQMEASTNTSARYIIGPYRVKFTGADDGTFP